MSTVGFNFLEEPELPGPQVTEARAEQIVAEHYGLRARAKLLGSNQDCNFIIHDDNDEILGVLKIANPAFTAAELEAQDAAADLIADAEPSLRIAVPVENVAGEKCTAITGLLDSTAYVRLLRYLPGGTLYDSGYLPPAAVAGLGEVAGRVSRALAGFHHSGLDRALQWDLRYGADVVARLSSHVSDPERRARAETASAAAWSRIQPLADSLPRQATHLDLTDANVVVSRGAGGTVHPDGVIDFGDLSHSWAVSELAITVSSVLGHPGSDPTSILPGVRAFHAIRPLSATEAEALWPMLVLRTAVLIVSGAQQAALDPDNAYVTEQTGGELRMFEQATSLPIDVMTALIKAELGLAGAPDPVVVDAALLAGLDPAEVVTLDLSSQSDAYDSAFTPGGWLRADIESELARDAVDDGAALVITRFGEPRLSRAVPLSQDSPAVVPTGISVWPAAAAIALAPWDGEVVDRADDGVTIRGRDHELTLTGVSPVSGPRLRAGEPLAEMSAGRWAELSVRPAGAPRAPQLSSAELSKGWLALSRDPRQVLGLPGLPHSHRADDLLARRGESFAHVQEHYYARPPQIERGWRHFLMSTAGRCYLDMVNNVDGARSCASAGGRDRRQATAQAEHELALQLRGGGRVQRAACRDAARTPGHRVSGQLRFGGKRFGDSAGDGGHRQA